MDTNPASWDPAGVTGLLRALGDPRTGAAPRLGLTAAAAALAFGGLMFALGVADQTAGRLSDEEVFVGVLGAIAAWLLVLYPIWSGYARWRRILRTVFACIVVMVAAIASASFFGIALRNSEFFIAGSLFSGVALVIAIVAASMYQGLRGRPMLATDGTVEVRCPACAYSMAGLDTCTCPECGHRCTLDELIKAQDYDSLRGSRAGSPGTPLLAAPQPA